MKRLLFTSLVAFTLTTAAEAAVLMADDFNVPDRTLNGSTPDVGASNWTRFSGGFNQTRIQGQELLSTNQVDNPGTTDPNDTTFAGEDTRVLFTQAQTGDVYSGFTLNVSKVNITAPAVFFLGVDDIDTNTPAVRVYSRPLSETQFTLGVGRTGTTPTSGSPQPDAETSALDINTDYRVVFQFDENGASDVVRLWVNPTSELSPSITSDAGAWAAQLSRIMHLQAGGTGDYTIDDLSVATSFAEVVPEPSTFLMVLGGMGMLIVRRKRSR